jgi:hypothetical protein
MSLLQCVQASRLQASCLMQGFFGCLQMLQSRNPLRLFSLLWLQVVPQHRLLPLPLLLPAGGAWGHTSPPGWQPGHSCQPHP